MSFISRAQMLSFLLLLLPCCQGWILQGCYCPASAVWIPRQSEMRLKVARSSSSLPEDDVQKSLQPQPPTPPQDLTSSNTDNPCSWQDLYDDDCSMSNIYAASFVAAKWIQSMPCGAGMKDCDMPEETLLPGVHDKAGVDKVDVMDFLGVKRAASIDPKNKKKEVPKEAYDV